MSYRAERFGAHWAGALSPGLADPDPKPSRWAQVAGGTLAVLGGIMLALCAVHEARAYLVQRSLDQQLRTIEAAAAHHFRGPRPLQHAPTTGDILGRIEIPRLGVSSVILEGVDDAVLDVAVGHIPDRAPFGRGNVVLAAHRDTHFRDLRDVQVGDEVHVETPQQDFEYRVVWMKITEPTDVSTIAPGGDDVLTLVTCYPFHYVGPAPRRFVVRAIRV